MPATNNAIEISNLSKEYPAQGRRGSVSALKDVSITIPKGSIFGLLGPNGAGKSTMINIMAGLVIKSAGNVVIDGLNIESHPIEYKRHIGIVPQELNLDSFFAADDLLNLQAGLWGVPKSQRRTQELLDIMQLGGKATSKTRMLSGGMRRRLMVAKAMVHSPPILVLDEPTAGVDIELRQQLWEHVKDLNKRGTTILLTTHYLEEAEALCDEIAILNHGKKMAQDSTKNLINQLDCKQLILKLSKKLRGVPTALKKFDATTANENELHISYRPSQTRVEEILAACKTAKLTILDLTTREADLEDVFVSLTK